MRILVVCGAGASSTFLVHRMTRLASDRGLSVDIRPGTILDLDRDLAGLDVVLVGHHLEDSYPALSARTMNVGVTAALLPPIAFDEQGAAVALELAESAHAGTRHPAPPLASTTASDPGSFHG